MKSIAFIDTEVSTEDNKSYDFGAIDNSGKQLHTGVPHEFFSFIENKDFICGHNIVDHDAKHISFDRIAMFFSSKFFFLSVTSNTKKFLTSSPAGIFILSGEISLTIAILEISASIFSFAAVFIWNFA